MDSHSVGSWTSATIAAFALVFKIRDLWRDPRRVMPWLVCLTIFLAAAVMLFTAPATIGYVNRVTGVPNFSAALVYCLLIGLSASALTLLTHWRNPAGRRRGLIRWWLAAAGAALAALIVLFWIGDAPIERRVDFDTYYAQAPYISAFIIIYLACTSVTYAWMSVLCWRWAKMVGRPWLRRGLFMIMASAVIALSSNLSKVVAVGARWTGGNVDVLSNVVAPALAIPAVMIGVTGFVLPLWGPQGASFRAYRQLGPLWDGLRAAIPEIVADVPVPKLDIQFRLTRRITEIHDGLLGLRPYVDPAVVQAAREVGQKVGLTGVDLDAAVEAAKIEMAIQAKHRGANVRRYDDGPIDLRSRDDATELRWLIVVSRAFKRSQLVGLIEGDVEVAQMRARLYGASS